MQPGLGVPQGANIDSREGHAVSMMEREKDHSTSLLEPGQQEHPPNHKHGERPPSPRAGGTALSLLLTAWLTSAWSAPTHLF